MHTPSSPWRLHFATFRSPLLSLAICVRLTNWPAFALTLTSCRNKLLVASGVHEGYTLRDLIKPDPARLRRNLSGIINFQKYREEKIEQWNEHGRKTVRTSAEKRASA